MNTGEISKDSFENYRQTYPDHLPLCTFKHILENLVDSIPDKVAFIQGDRQVTWKQFDERTNRISCFLLDLGMKKGDRVGINGFNSIEWMEVFWGAAKVGLAPVNLNPRYVGDECRYVLEDADCSVVFTEDSWISNFELIKNDLPLLKKIVVYNAPGYEKKEIPEGAVYELYANIMNQYPSSSPKLEWDVRNDDLSFLKYTGGTTGYPRGVIFDNWRGCGGVRWGYYSTIIDCGWDIMKFSIFRELFGNSPQVDMLASTTGELKSVKKLIIQEIIPDLFGQPISYKLGSDSSSVLCAPVFHGVGFTSTMVNICSRGTTIIYLEPSHPFSPKVFWETVVKHKPTGVSIVGDALAIPIVEEAEGMINEGNPYDASSLVNISSSGVRLSAKTKKRLLKIIPGCALMDNYGITEAAGGFASFARSEEDIAFEQTTPALDSYGYATKRLIIDLETNQPAKPGCKRALFLYGGPFVGLGYWKSPELTKKTYVDIDGEKYVVSGDEGYLDEKGGFHLMGRGGDYLINTGGEKVYSEEVEEIIKSNPKVRDAAVVGITDSRWGETVAAVVELNEGAIATQEEIMNFCRDKMAGYKIPKVVVIHEVLRKGPGKIDRKKNIQLILEEKN